MRSTVKIQGFRNILLIKHEGVSTMIPCAADTWSLTKKNIKILQTTQRTMKRSLLEIRKIDRVKMLTLKRKFLRSISWEDLNYELCTENYKCKEDQKYNELASSLLEGEERKTEDSMEGDFRNYRRHFGRNWETNGPGL